MTERRSETDPNYEVVLRMLDSEPVRKYTVSATRHAWRWTYTDITAADALDIASRLTSFTGEQWTVEPAGQYGNVPESDDLR